ncbi:MAG: alkaline phosphatase [Desulfobaccales bacterium]
MQRSWVKVLLIFWLFWLWRLPVAGAAAHGPETTPSSPPVKNLIVLIVDGCGADHYTLARWFKAAPLTLDQMYVGAVKTHSSDAVVTDSAAAATAFATGWRTSNNLISVAPKQSTLPGVPSPAPGQAYKPLATVLEGAKLLGKATGLAVTCRVSHATPAAYYAHASSRAQENVIMEQGVYQNLDVVLGGGRQHLLPPEKGGRRADREDLLEVLKQRGYTVVSEAQQLSRVKSGRVYGLFADSHLEAEIDRLEFAPGQPTLEAMTRKALELLGQNPDGFFLLVEGSQVDWASHANDPAHLLSDLLMFDRAVQAALEFAQKDGATLVLAFSDHNCGGLSLGNYATDKTYSRLTPEDLVGALRKMTLSASGIWRKLGAAVTPEDLRQAVQKYWRIDLTAAEAARIITLARKYSADPHNALGETICQQHTSLGWTTHGHTGGDVPLFAYGPHRPVGLLDAPEIGRLCARVLGIDLEALNQRLFQEAQQALGDGRVAIDPRDPENPVVKISYHGKQAELPVNKNILRLEGKEISLEGVVVITPDTGKAYLPFQAVQLLKGDPSPLPPISGK